MGNMKEVYSISIPLDMSVMETSDGSINLHDLPPVGTLLQGQATVMIVDGSLHIVLEGVTRRCTDLRTAIKEGEEDFLPSRLVRPAMVFDRAHPTRRKMAHLKYPNQFHQNHHRALLDAECRPVPPSTLKRSTVDDPPSTVEEANAALKAALLAKCPAAYLTAWCRKLAVQGLPSDFEAEEIVKYHLDPAEDAPACYPHPSWFTWGYTTMSHSPEFSFRLAAMEELENGKIPHDARETDLALLQRELVLRGTDDVLLVARGFKVDSSLDDCIDRWKDVELDGVGLVAGIIIGPSQLAIAFFIFPKEESMYVLGEGEEVKKVAEKIMYAFIAKYEDSPEAKQAQAKISYESTILDPAWTLQQGLSRGAPSDLTAWHNQLIEPANPTHTPVHLTMRTRLMREICKVKDEVDYWNLQAVTELDVHMRGQPDETE